MNWKPLRSREMVCAAAVAVGFGFIYGPEGFGFGLLIAAAMTSLKFFE